MKKLLIALAGAACLLSSVSAAQADQLQDIEKRGVIRIAVPQDFPPFGSVGTDLQPQGMTSIWRAIWRNRWKLKLQLVPVTSANRVPYLQTDKVDLVISSLGKNAEREKVIDFSRAYAPFFLGVFGPKGAELKDAAALSGKSIGVTRGAVEDMVLTSVAPQARRLSATRTITLRCRLTCPVRCSMSPPETWWWRLSPGRTPTKRRSRALC